ncbi:hypothetical protein EV210_101160 [Anaerospora hongkongensis]|uniref:Uncharacterized protein n=1 Tax=Anaerospora hongkongensis TaxID=244830 RepID=A0A4R1Q4L8_9FIRM|nr:hypothetical protein [Anaerospora hongkongensis]TCL39962.1 hypothetical protein EV210_101160 [Anaerospora hongkongensis]
MKDLEVNLISGHVLYFTNVKDEEAKAVYDKFINKIDGLIELRDCEGKTGFEMKNVNVVCVLEPKLLNKIGFLS